jgi:Na+-driven multidrug efflux pump
MNKQHNNPLGEEKIGKLMLQFSIPCILSLLVASLYNMVDQVFIGHGIGYLGNGATNVVFPITVMALAIALMIGDGCAARLSICQGQGDQETAHKAVGNAVTLMVVIGLIMTAIFFFLKEQILWGFGATENNIEYAREYFNYIIIGIPFYVFGNSINSIIRADGSPKFAMFSTLIGCIINLIFDPVLIFICKWGMMGAAVATIAGQIVTAIMGAYYLFHTKSFRLKKTSFVPRASIIKQILPLGISSFLTQISIVIIMAVMNNSLVHYGAKSVYGQDIPMTVVGIVMKVFQLVVAFVVGIAAGSQPIVGYNYGAGKMDRVKKIFKNMMIAEFGIGVISMILFQCFPLQIISIFGSGDALYEEFAVLAFRIYLGGIILCCIQKASSIFLQSLGKPVLSTVLSLLRDFVLIVPLALILPIRFGVVGILFSAPVSDIVAFIVTVLIMRHTIKNVLTVKEHNVNARAEGKGSNAEYALD